MKIANLNYFLALIITSLLIFGCKNPLKEEQKKELVLILVDRVLEPEGLYVYYWDGKDKNDKYVEPGRYIFFLEVGKFQDQVFATAEGGGKVGKNMDEHFEVFFSNSFEVGTPYPDPFRLLEGVNIPIIVAEPARVKLSIYKD